MGQSTDWFLANVDEAAELGCALPDELVDTWKNISLRDVLELELEELSKVVCGSKFLYRPDLIYPEDAAADAGPSVTSEVFEGGTFVTLVPDAFIRALAAIRDSDLGTIASVWQSKAEHMRDWAPVEVSGVLQTMRDFAALSLTSRKSVLSVFEA
jgi:hypothetical protein